MVKSGSRSKADPCDASRLNQRTMSTKIKKNPATSQKPPKSPKWSLQIDRTTKIEWTDHTFNPWWGCQKVSPACTHCYAESVAKRGGKAVWGASTGRFFPSQKNWDNVRKLDAAAAAAGVRQRIFSASMADLFEDRQDLIQKRQEVWKLIEETVHLDWQLLTKRPDKVASMVPPAWLISWPKHVWIGCTVEDQLHAQLRLPHLVQLPAAIRFVSCEPLLGPLNLTPWLGALQWVIAGGESGPVHRKSAPNWFRALRDDCLALKVPFFFKQWGGRWNSENGSLLDGREWKEFPVA